MYWRNSFKGNLVSNGIPPVRRIKNPIDGKLK